MDNMKTYKVGSNGEMTPMVNVWMTMEEYSLWLEDKASIIRVEENNNDPVIASQNTSHNGSTHQSHATPERPAVYKDKGNKSVMSQKRMSEFLDSYNRNEGDVEAVAKDLDIRASSVYKYKSIAVKNGLLKRTSNVRPTSASGKPPISDARAKLVGNYYEMFGKDMNRLAKFLGIKNNSAKVYVGLAKSKGYIE